MSKKAFNIFFAVGDPSRRSSLWRAWGTSKGDVCLMNCEVDSDFKLTLHPPDERHATSRCHLSYRDEESFEAAKGGTHPVVVAEELPVELAKATSDGYGRFEDVWEPKEIAPELAMPFRLLLPDSELRDLRREVLTDREVVWLPTPGGNRAVEVALMLAGEQVPRGTIPGAEAMGSRFLFRHEFTRSRTFLIVWRDHDLSQEEEMWVAAYRLSILAPSEGVRASLKTHDYHRVMVQVRDDAHGSRAIIDTAVD